MLKLFFFLNHHNVKLINYHLLNIEYILLIFLMLLKINFDIFLYIFGNMLVIIININYFYYIFNFILINIT